MEQASLLAKVATRRCTQLPVRKEERGKIRFFS
jgi:hypothetical protein